MNESGEMTCRLCRNRGYACDMCGPEKLNFEVGLGRRMFGCTLSEREAKAIAEKGNNELLSQYCDSTQRDIEEISRKGKVLNRPELAEAAIRERVEQAKEVVASF